MSGDYWWTLMTADASVLLQLNYKVLWQPHSLGLQLQCVHLGAAKLFNHDLRLMFTWLG